MSRKIVLRPRGRLRDDLAEGLRVLAFERSAVIAYRVDGDIVRIVAIFYRGRDYEAILKGGLEHSEKRESEDS